MPRTVLGHEQEVANYMPKKFFLWDPLVFFTIQTNNICPSLDDDDLVILCLFQHYMSYVMLKDILIMKGIEKDLCN